MRPKQRDEKGSGDLFRARLDQIIDMMHELVQLADEIDWAWIDDQVADRFSAAGRKMTHNGLVATRRRRPTQPVNHVSPFPVGPYGVYQIGVV